MNKALGSSCTSCWKRAQHKADASQVLQGPCPPVSRSPPPRRYGRAEPHDSPGLCKQTHAGGALEWDAGIARAGRTRAAGHDVPVGCYSLLISAPPLGEGDWFIAYPTNWCLRLHYLHWVDCVRIQGYVIIFLYRIWVCKTLFPFRLGLARLCPAGSPGGSVLPVVRGDFMWEGRGSCWLKFCQSSWHPM